MNVITKALGFVYAKHQQDSKQKEMRQAIRELETFSDRELMDLGLVRGDIERAVRYGRIHHYV